jgi:hypothetical protein
VLQKIWINNYDFADKIKWAVNHYIDLWLNDIHTYLIYFLKQTNISSPNKLLFLSLNWYTIFSDQQFDQPWELFNQQLISEFRSNRSWVWRGRLYLNGSDINRQSTTLRKVIRGRLFNQYEILKCKYRVDQLGIIWRRDSFNWYMATHLWIGCDGKDEAETEKSPGYNSR